MALIAELIINIIRMALLAAVAVGGILLGKRLRVRHEKKQNAVSGEDKQQ